MARNLTEMEIENILDFIKPNKGLPEDTGLSLVDITKERLKSQLICVKVYPEIISKLKDKIMHNYYTSLIESGESVGIITAQSIGEKNTQMMLNTFHKAGQAHKGTTQEVPRFQELLNATHDPKMASCKIFFNSGSDTIQNLRNVIKHNIVEINILKISKKITIYLGKEPENWYDTCEDIYKDEEWFRDFRKYEDCIRIELNLDTLYEYKIPIEEIVKTINQKYSDLSCVFSPLNIGIIDIYADMTDISLPKDRLLFITTENAKEIYLEEVVQPTLEKQIIAGIPGIEYMYYTTTEDGEWIIETEGSNYIDVLCSDIVDPYKTTSNDVWEILQVLGIEATRQFLIEEFMSIMEGINSCHSRLLSDRMCFSGSIASITRYTMKREENSIFSRTSFEETVDGFTKAAFNGDVDYTKSISASIICGTQGKIGSGITDLMIDVAKLVNMPKLLDTVKEESEYVKNKKMEYKK